MKKLTLDEIRGLELELRETAAVGKDLLLGKPSLEGAVEEVVGKNCVEQRGPTAKTANRFGEICHSSNSLFLGGFRGCVIRNGYNYRRL